MRRKGLRPLKKPNIFKIFNIFKTHARPMPAAGGVL
nr:MAG TPA: hypothetical protein [Caudoviricetes sp.]